MAGGEIQGCHLSARSHQVGVSLAKRLDILQSTLWLLFEREVVPVAWVERLVGK